MVLKKEKENPFKKIPSDEEISKMFTIFVSKIFHNIT